MTAPPAARRTSRSSSSPSATSPTATSSPPPSSPFDGPAFEALGRAFQAHWRKLFPDTRGGLWMPLWHLRSDGFWHPQPRSPHSPPPAAPNCMANLRERFAGARIDDELWQRLQAPQPREELRALLLARYFDAPTRELLAQSIRWNRAAERYADQLTDPAPGTPLPLDTEPVRSQGFRIAVLRAYEHRCGACGLRLQTPDGQSAVQAAHIKPWSQFHDDRIAQRARPLPHLPLVLRRLPLDRPDPRGHPGLARRELGAEPADAPGPARRTAPRRPHPRTPTGRIPRASDGTTIGGKRTTPASPPQALRPARAHPSPMYPRWTQTATPATLPP
jgi:hypothetical protein